MRRAAAAGAIALVGLLLGACGGGGQHKSRLVSQRSPSLDCAQYIDTRPPTPDYTVVLGVVALPIAPKSAALQTGPSGLPDPSSRLFAKTGLLIRTGTKFELVIPPAWAGRLWIGWANGPARPGPGLLVNCHPYPADRSGWLAYPGGFWLRRPACVPLLIKTGARSRRVQVGLGTPCPGQRPPAGPTQS
ncbi:MAG TPA: hypothetical protein VLC49_07220 [Solirubrobacteraceae bacterium]|nr:hypothetical protein [Solirubrobacteraceae bacterium]